ncbi:ArsR family transcriptional regulator [Intrasporangium oryzae NRRL B-24470]|uniref:ArsR family transcriptional regulator n=1 Tax=Intrasporangium oryzae NRRL B-24470 TaxID=1386089 RepID=W9GGU2_9MICO|nr:helix-turn-helix domain-containing protein [Intrasporangium oryzae]EWT03074.1 ArsR family transcriptional regulator [Intrasporangium oryzae NRRL B-24470]
MAAQTPPSSSPPSPPPAPGSASVTGPSDAVHLDAQSLKVLAHPLRSRLLSTLRLGGPATATDLAALLGTNSGATSYHLRKLESVGLVEDTGEGEGKRRLWRPSTEFTAWNPSDFEGDEDSETALNWLTRDYARHFSEQYDKWLDVSMAWPAAWQDACGSSDSMALVTPEQLVALRDEVWEVIERYRRVGQGNPQARRVAVYAFAYPLDLDRPPASRARGGKEQNR